MKKPSNSVSPFIMLIIPALLIIGFKSKSITEVPHEKHQASTCFQMPALKGIVKVLF